MTSNSYDIAVLIGRFQPFHNGHATLLKIARHSAPRVLIVLGSAYSGRNARNPFSWEERAALIHATLDPSIRSAVEFVPIRDYYNDERWINAVLRAVRSRLQENARVALIGYQKDSSSYYLDDFTGWDFIAAPYYENIDATALRKIWFEGDNAQDTYALLAPLMPEAVLAYLQNWAALPYFSRLRAEHWALEASKKMWGSGPFITVDAVVKASDQVLLIRRGRDPGKGMLALPGGFLDSRERILSGAIRELREETGINLGDAFLRDTLVAVHVFDHQDRSQRGRTITHAHFFDFRDMAPPPVMGSDDAAAAQWFFIHELLALESEFFEDHFNILDYFFKLTE